MADINLDDLLAARKKETGDTAVPDLPPREEIERIAKKVEQLTPEDRRKVDAIKESLDLTDSGASLQFGAAAQKDIAEFSDSVLARVRAKDSGEVGALLGELVSKIKGFEPEEDKGFLKKIPLIGDALGKAGDIMAQYQTLSTQIAHIEASLDKSRADLMKDIATFDGLYEKNLDYFKGLQLYIVAGEEKLAEMRETTLPKLHRQAAESADPMAAQVVSDFEAGVERFEKKLHDLKLSKMIAIQTAPQIRLIQNSDKDLVDRVQSAIYNTIPLWKNQIVIALGLSRQQKVIAQQRAVSDTTNDLLKKNAALLKQNSIEAARENERGIVDIETVKQVNADLVATIEETLRIQEAGRAKRQAAEKELAGLEDQLKKTLLAAGNRQRQGAGEV
ncbi:MAG: toxic anion resistance protein [Schwartzia sp.]|nr:toxic anion resistance protein [Schwartzia sp. (in: firmicutes)]